MQCKPSYEDRQHVGIVQVLILYACLQALTLTMIAYATFAHSPPDSLLTAVSEHALLSLGKFEQQAIANLIWALALLHALSPQMWDKLLDAFSSVDDQQGGQQCWAYI